MSFESQIPDPSSFTNPPAKSSASTSWRWWLVILAVAVVVLCWTGNLSFGGVALSGPENPYRWK